MSDHPDPLLERLQEAVAPDYRVERRLGAGGMGYVYLAHEVMLNRDVAIKVLRPERDTVDGGEAFLREAQVLGSIRHPNVVVIYRPDERNGLKFYYMELIGGPTLEDRIASGPLPARDVVQIGLDVLAGLIVVHRLGLVHRDIKPGNIFLLPDRAVLSDFGIAQLISGEATERRADGTPDYMAPEQVERKSITLRSDIYSLGVVLYEAVSGRRFHEQGDHVDWTGIPSSLARVLQRAVARAPEDRWPDAAEFRKALEGTTAPSVPRLVALVAGGGVSLGAVALLIYLIVPRPRPPDSASRASSDPNLVAVAPFDVLAPNMELWREGLVDVLSRNLDGAGPLRTVAPTLVIRSWRGHADPIAAADLGRRTGARLVLFGAILGAGPDSIRLSATLLDTRPVRALVEIEYRDAAARMDRLSDSLTVAVLRELGRTRPIAAVRLGSFGSASLPAIKAFLKGEQLLRRFSLDSAASAYEYAVQRDSTFALALSRVGLVRGWRGQSGGPLGLKAGRFNHGLAPRDSLLIVADSLEAASDDSLDNRFWSHRVRKFAALEEASRRYPEDPQVWYALGEARFHLGYVVGSSAAQTVDAFNRAIALDAAFAPAYFHPVQLALDRDDTAAATSYVNRYLGLTSQVPEGAGIRLVHQLLNPSQTKSPKLQAVLDTASANVLFDAWRTVQRWPDSAETGVRLLRHLASGRRGIGIAADTATTGYLLAGELLFRGHLREASEMIGSRFSVPFAELAVLGVVAADSAAAVLNRWLFAPNQELVVADPPWVARCYRSFLAAEWWASRQDTVALVNLMRRGDSVARSARTLPRQLDGRADASLAQAALALARRDTAEALRQFLAFPDSLCSSHYGSLSPGLAPLQMVRIALLAATGRDRDAARVFDQQVVLPLAASAVVATLRRARVAERLGDRLTAVRHYRFVVRAWHHADLELQPMVAEARAAIVRLTDPP